MNSKIPQPNLIIVPALRNITKLQEPKDPRWELFNQFLEAKDFKENTIKTYRNDIRSFLQWSSTDWKDLKIKEFIDYKKYLLEKDNKNKHLKPATIVRALKTMKNFYNWLLICEYIKTNPTATVELPSIPEHDSRSLKPKSIQLIFEKIKELKYSERNLPIFALLLHGLRASEVCKLNLEDFDGEKIYIKESKCKSIGFVPLEQWTIDLINYYLKWSESKTVPKTDPLFISFSKKTYGRRITYCAIQELCKELSALCSFNFTAHQLRHTFATNLILSGMEPYSAMTLMRQKSMTNFRRYAKAANYIKAEKEFKEISKNKSILL